MREPSAALRLVKTLSLHFAVLAALLSCCGCMTISSKYPSIITLGEKHSSELGHPYSGTTALFNEWRCFGELFPVSLIAYNVLTPIMVIDIPLSFAADTLFLPADLIIEPSTPRRGYSCHFHI